MRNDLDLLVIAVASPALVLLSIFTSGIPRVIFGLAFVVFFPGYALLAALFPGRRFLGGVERLALSLGMSVALIAFIAFALNYTPWGIRQYPVMVASISLVLFLALIARYRRGRLSPGERPFFRFGSPFTALARSWSVQRRANRVLGSVLAVAVLAVAAVLVLMIATPGPVESFTEFYILNTDGKADTFRRELLAGDETTVIIGIVNHEQSAGEYRVEISIGAEIQKEIGPFYLGHGETWQQPETFIITGPGAGRQVRFLLYKSEADMPYQELVLVVDVKEPS